MIAHKEVSPILYFKSIEDLLVTTTTRGAILIKLNLVNSFGVSLNLGMTRNFVYNCIVYQYTAAEILEKSFSTNCII